MATLSIADRAEVHALFMRSADCPGSLTKADLRAAVDAADAWADSNAAAFNAALPAAARTALTARQKAALLAFVIERRHGVA
jgi:hypothetical protein